MKKLIVTTAVSALLAFPALAEEPVTDDDAMKAAVTFTNGWCDAYNANKSDGITALFVPGGVFVPSSASAKIVNAQGLQNFIVARINDGWTNESIKVLEARPVGNEVSLVLSYKLTGSGTKAGKQIIGYAVDYLTPTHDGWRAKMIVDRPTAPPADLPR